MLTIVNYQAGYYRVTTSLLYKEICLKHSETWVKIEWDF